MHIVGVRTIGALLLVALVSALSMVAAGAQQSVPVVIVFPFQPNGKVPPNMGEQIAAVLADRIGDDGKVTVKPAPQGSTPQTFRSAAQAAGADYYISGFVTPFGNGIAMVEYVVSTHTGTAVYSQTVMATNQTDVESQGYVLRNALLALARPESSGSEAGAAPASTGPSPSPSATHPAAAAVSYAGQRWVVVEVGGGAEEAQRAQAQQALIAALKAAGVTAVADSDAAPQGPALTREICSENDATHLVTATLTNDRGRRSFDGTLSASLFDCASGAPQRTADGSGYSVEKAAQAAAAALVSPPPTHHR